MPGGRVGRKDWGIDMKKNLYPFGIVSVLLVGFLLACNFLTAPVTQSQTEFPTATANSTETSSPVPTITITSTTIPILPTATHTPFSTATRIVALLPVSSTPEFAPFCELQAARPSQCQYPIAEQSSSFCEYKSPYNLIALNDWATYELLHEHVQCSEAGVINGQRMITCTGPMAYYYELQVCDSACSTLRIEKNSLRCPWDYNYNNLQDCCTKETQTVDQGCVVLKLDTRSCVVDCGEFTTKGTCTDHGYSCRWNDTLDSCQLRR